MNNLKIVKISKVKNKEIRNLCEYYKKLLSRYNKLNIVTLDPINKSDREEVRKAEGKKLISLIDKSSFNILLDENGSEFSSIEFAKLLSSKFDYGKSIIFFIAGTFGIDNKSKGVFDLKLSLSKMTLPHEMAYLVLLEQLFRVSKILSNQNYHY